MQWYIKINYPHSCRHISAIQKFKINDLHIITSNALGKYLNCTYQPCYSPYTKKNSEQQLLTHGYENKDRSILQHLHPTFS
jgi:hypothetical protein